MQAILGFPIDYKHRETLQKSCFRKRTLLSVSRNRKLLKTKNVPDTYMYLNWIIRRVVAGQSSLLVIALVLKIGKHGSSLLYVCC